jgi:hypothetical protein
MKTKMPMLLINGLIAGMILALAPEALPAAGDGPASYETGPAAITKITGELYSALPAKRRQQLLDHPVLIEESTPWIAPVEQPGGGRAVQTVQITSGFIHLINYLSHAKAMDEVERGFFNKYATALAGDTTPELQMIVQGRDGQDPWAFDTMNHQASCFNQIFGSLVAIEMAHHYLGHYRKYASQLVSPEGRPVPICSVLSVGEWKESVLKGARNALDCGLGIDGLKTIMECVDRMPSRPAWSEHIIHAKSDTSKLRKELEKMEKNFFLAGD